MIRILFPNKGRIKPLDSFRLFLISEGYTEADRSAFFHACTLLIEYFLNTTPFNKTQKQNNWLNIYAIFTPSVEHGCAIDNIPTANRTAFGSHFDSRSGQLSFNEDKIRTFINTQTFLNKPLSDICLKGLQSHGRLGNSIVLMLPPITSYPNVGEYENFLSRDDYHFAATTTVLPNSNTSNQNNNFWQQIILRSMAEKLGLGNEYEMPGAENQSPTLDQVKTLPFNLHYFDSLQVVKENWSKNKWFSLMSNYQRSADPTHMNDFIHGKLNGDIIDITRDLLVTRPDNIEFWEGGGKFRKNVWRSARDCLMRRKIASSAYPVRNEKVPFCLPCQYYLSKIIW